MIAREHPEKPSLRRELARAAVALGCLLAWGGLAGFAYLMLTEVTR